MASRISFTESAVNCLVVTQVGRGDPNLPNPFSFVRPRLPSSSVYVPLGVIISTPIRTLRSAMDVYTHIQHVDDRITLYT